MSYTAIRKTHSPFASWAGFRNMEDYWLAKGPESGPSGFRTSFTGSFAGQEFVVIEVIREFKIRSLRTTDYVWA